MMHIGKLIRLNALVAAMLAAAPTLADDAAGKANTDKPDKIQEQLSELKTSLLDLKTSLAEIKTDLKHFRTDHDVSTQASSREIRELKDEMLRLKTELDSLRRTPSSSQRESGFAPAATTTPLPPMGRVELLNTWTAPVSVVVNNRSYRLRPMDRVVTDPIPAGAFNYEVIGVTAPNNVRTLAANEVYLIHIHPQP